MKYPVESRYLVIFGFSLITSIVTLVLSINKFQPFLLQQMLTSCTAMYTTITANSLILSIILVVGLVGLLVSLSLKLVLSSYKTTQSLLTISTNAQNRFPSTLLRICKELGVSKNIFIITNHKKPLALTAGLFSPKIIFSKGLIQSLTYKELQAVVLHEVYHQQHRHGLLYIVAEAISSALSFIVPVLRDVTDNMKLEFENVADHHALLYQGSPVYIVSALSKLSGQTAPSKFPSFATVIDHRLELLHSPRQKKLKLSKNKIIISSCMLMLLSFFATMPVTKIQPMALAVEDGQCSSLNVCSDLCVNKFNAGMSKDTNYSSNLPASVF